MIKIRATKKSDYIGIKQLFSRNGMQMMSISNWFNLWDNPELKKRKKKILGFIIETNNFIVGHIGSYPAMYSYKNTNLICNILHGWVIEPKYRNYSFSLLKKYFSEIDSDFFLSTTTSPIAGRVLEILKWQKINLLGLTQVFFIIFNSKKFLYKLFTQKNFYFKKKIITILSVILNFFVKHQLNKIKKIQSISEIKIYKKFDKKFDVFWQKYKKENKNKILFSRNIRWLKWLFKNLILSKKIKILTINQKNKIVGCCIFVINKKNNIKFAQLIDVLTLKSYQNLLLPLISKSILLAKENKCAFIEFKNTRYENLKLVEYFRPLKIQRPHNYFFIKIKNDIKNKNLKIKNLHLSSIDGDTLFNT